MISIFMKRIWEQDALLSLLYEAYFQANAFEMYLNDYDFFLASSWILATDDFIDVLHALVSKTGNNNHEWLGQEVTGGIALMCREAAASTARHLNQEFMGRKGLLSVASFVSGMTVIAFVSQLRNALCARDQSLNIRRQGDVTSDVFARVKLLRRARWTRAQSDHTLESHFPLIDHFLVVGFLPLSSIAVACRSVARVNRAPAHEVTTDEQWKWNMWTNETEPTAGLDDAAAGSGDGQIQSPPIPSVLQRNSCRSGTTWWRTKWFPSPDLYSRTDCSLVFHEEGDDVIVDEELLPFARAHPSILWVPLLSPHSSTSWSSPFLNSKVEREREKILRATWKRSRA